MKYEFRVGDYVETKSGTIGFILDAQLDGLTYWRPTKLSDADIRADNYSVGGSYCVFSYDRFKRIGRYDFTTQDAIKPLDYTERFIRCAPINDVNMIFMRKINELVNAVNELKGAQDG